MDAESSQEEVQCLMCRRSFSLDIEVNDGFEAIFICRECKMVVLNDNNERSVGIRDIRRRRQQGRRSRFRRYESTEDSFSQRISYLINLASQSHEADGDSSFVPRHRMTYNGTPSRSRRWRASSDNESDGADQMDSVFGESDSNVSFGGYGGDSDASLDRNSLLDRDMLIQLDNESYIYTDTDIDPMHAGLDQWNSDDQNEEEEEWEEADFDETTGLMEPHQQFQTSNASPSATGEREPQDGAWLHWRMRGSQGVYYADIFADLEESEIRPAFLGNPDDYVDARRFEELLEQLAENDGSRRGAPPAAASFVARLPSVVISRKHYEKNGSLICPVCKDSLSINTEAKQLPCLHLYHPSCILPWLSTRNSCPVCRYELPTDDPEYETAKRHMMNRGETHTTQQQYMTEEISYDVTNVAEAEEALTVSNVEIEEGRLEEVNQVARRSNGWGGRNGWWLLATAPIVSLVGIMLVLWFRNPPCDRRRHCSIQEQNGQQPRVSQTTRAPEARKRRWWSIF
ncbi:uncharacterized protein [Typha angustifolia]